MSLAMSIHDRQAFLADVHVGIVSIPRTFKGPLTVPIWYDYEPGGNVWMLTDQSSIKGNLLKKADRISLCAQTEQAPYQYVSVEGPFEISASQPDQLLSMAIRYLGETMGKQYADGSGNSDSIVVSLSPETWYSVDYNKLPS